jgi:hypothetical protein
MTTFKNPNERPSVEPPNIDGIPAYVRKFPHWVLWRFDWVDETQTWAKVLYDAQTFNRAKSDTPSTWVSFTNVTKTFADKGDEFDGIGFVFSVDSDDLCGIDFDNCVEDGELKSGIAERLVELDSYTELSVSGTGLHVIVRGTFGKGRKRNDIEVYDRGRYFTFSGRSWDDPPKSVKWRQSQLEKLKADVFPETPITEVRPRPISINKSTNELLGLAFASKNGDSISRLYDGIIDGYAGDDSAADLALCSKLAFWSGGDPGLLDEMFRGSRLYRDKWNKKHSADGRTYGQMTLDKALAQCTTFYGEGVYRGQSGTSESKTSIGSGVYRVRDLRDKLFKLYDSGGRKPGEHPGWENLAKFYTIKKRQFTVLTGIPGAGKTAILDCMLVNLAQLVGWKFAVCSVENQPIEDHLSVLLEIYTGQPFSPGPTKRMARDTIEQSLDWFDKHFTFVLPDESERTLQGVVGIVSQLDVDGVVVDPWNELEHRRPPQMTETEYVSQSLSKMRHHARTHDQHWWLVAHPTKLQKDKNGQYMVPTLYDIAGSAHFRNKCDFGLVVWRDPTVMDGPSTVFVQKVRFRWCGEVGQCDLYFNRVTGQFSERDSVSSERTYYERETA